MKRFFNVIGPIITVIALGYVAWSLYNSGVFTNPIWTSPILWLWIAGLSFCYALCLVIIAFAWILHVNAASETKIKFWDGLRIYSISQIYKYLPSNMLHFVGRHTMLRAHKIDHSGSVWSAFAETALLVLGAVAVSTAFGLTYFKSMVTGETLENLTKFTPVLLGVIAITAIIIYFFLPRFRSFFQPKLAIAALKSLPLYIGFFVLAGCILWAQAHGLGIARMNNAIAIIAISASAWVLGYITPGASAGIGVREALLITGLSSVGLGSEAAILAVAYRMITTLGDIIFAGLGWTIKRCTPQSN